MKVATAGTENPPWSYTDQKENVYACICLFRYLLMTTTSPSETSPVCKNRKDKPSLLWFISGKRNVTRLVYFTISVLPYYTVKYIFQLDSSLKSCSRPECHFNGNVFLQCNFLSSPKERRFDTDYQKIVCALHILLFCITVIFKHHQLTDFKCYPWFLR